MTTHPAVSDAAAPPRLDHLAILADLQARFLATIPAVDPAVRVPWCGAWRASDLVEHLAEIHHWAAGRVRREKAVPLDARPLEDLYRACAAELLGTLTAVGPDAPTWTLNGDGPASFWRRRQVHETLVHLWDLRTAAGLDVRADPALWADTVDEVVTVMQPRQVRLERSPRLPAPIALVAPDVGRTWLLDSAAPGDPAVTVTGSAESLALLLWGRPTVGPAVTGDRTVLADALALGLTP